VNKSRLLAKIKAIEAATSAKFDTLITLCASDDATACKIRDRLMFKKGRFPQECHLASMSIVGGVRTSRLLKPDLRRPRRKNALASKRIHEAEIYPPLSDRERAFVKIDPKGRVEWTTGYMYWDIRPDAKTNEYNMFVYLANHFGHEIVCGPSDHTSSMLEVNMLFHNGTQQSLALCVLGCIAWMSNPPDHSPYEILLAAVPYGLKYSIDKNPYEFAVALLRLQIPKHRHPKAGMLGDMDR
jgi:hypothetical protein